MSKVNNDPMCVSCDERTISPKDIMEMANRMINENHLKVNDLGFLMEDDTPRATVILFRTSGKYYSEETWRIPENASGPFDMLDSTDYRTIGGGAVLVVTQEPWGYPHLILSGGFLNE